MLEGQPGIPLGNSLGSSRMNFVAGIIKHTRNSGGLARVSSHDSSSALQRHVWGAQSDRTHPNGSRSDASTSNATKEGLHVSKLSRGLAKGREMAGHWPTLVSTLLLVITAFAMLPSWKSSSSPHTLVVFVFSNTDPESLMNLRFFVKHGIRPKDGAEYIIIMHQGEGMPVPGLLPDLPPNARYEVHATDACHHWGMIGWLLQHRQVDTRRYKYFVLLDSSARGPFLPTYWPQGLHWSTALTSRICRRIKLVGPVISCQGAPKDGVLSNEWRTNPHVLGHVVATDQAGLKALRQDPHIFACHSSYHDVRYHSELGASLAVLQAGYNLDSLMVRYEGVDWRNKANWDCNERMDPTLQNANDGVSMEPMEVMFVKMRAHYIDAGWTFAKTAFKYTTWRDHPNRRHNGLVSPHHVIRNDWKYFQDHLKRPVLLTMLDIGSDCFDVDHYKSSNPDIPDALKESPVSLWQHFVHYGVHEGRPFRYTCGIIKQLAQQREADSLPGNPANTLVQPCVRLFGAQPADDNNWLNCKLP